MNQFPSGVKDKPNSQYPLCFALPWISARGVCRQFASVKYGSTANSLKCSPTAVRYDNKFNLIQIVLEMLVVWD